jgi:hypothetical protein
MLKSYTMLNVCYMRMLFFHIAGSQYGPVHLHYARRAMQLALDQEFCVTWRHTSTYRSHCPSRTWLPFLILDSVQWRTGGS